jgi:hypothetical protein
MTKKDFQLIADAIACAVEHKVKTKDLAEHFATFLQQTNLRFDRERFIKACEVK